MKYYALQCKSCGKWAGKQLCLENVKKAVFRCPFCNKLAKLKHKDEIYLNMKIKGPCEATEIAKVVQTLNNWELVKKLEKERLNLNL